MARRDESWYGVQGENRDQKCTQVIFAPSSTPDSAANLMDDTVAGKVRATLCKIQNADSESGVGSGYPDCAAIKSDIPGWAKYLNDEMDVDVVLDVRNRLMPW